MYILFEMIRGDQIDPRVKLVASYISHMVGYIDPQEESIADISNLNSVVLTEEQGKNGWKFAGNYRGYVSIRVGSTLHDDQLVASMEPAGTKHNYIMTDEDKALGVSFQKLVLKDMAKLRFQRKFAALDSGATDYTSQVASLNNIKNTVDSAIDSANSIADLNLVQHNYFGIQAPLQQFIDQGLGQATLVL